MGPRTRDEPTQQTLRLTFTYGVCQWEGKKGTFEHEFMIAFYESWYENLISSPNEKYN